MNTTYGWLYQHYAHPLLEKQRQKARRNSKRCAGNMTWIRSSRSV